MATTKRKNSPINLNICRVCEKNVMVSIFKGTGLCSINCAKIENGEHVASPVVANTDCA